MSGQDWLIVWTALTAFATSATALAVWRRERAVVWRREPDGTERARNRVVNIGHGTARNVRVRIGSAANPHERDDEQTVERVRPGEAVSFLNEPMLRGPADYSVNVTWLSRFGRERRWSFPLI